MQYKLIYNVSTVELQNVYFHFFYEISVSFDLIESIDN